MIQTNPIHHNNMNITQDEQPKLSVQIPNPWPAASFRVSEMHKSNFGAEEDKKANKLQNLFQQLDLVNSTPSSSNSSSITITNTPTGTRPNYLKSRSLSNRQENPIPTTKIIAAAISTQSPSNGKEKSIQRRSRIVSANMERTSSGSSSSGSSASSFERDQQFSNKSKQSSTSSSSSEGEQDQKFATLPKSKAQSLRKIIEQQRRHSRSNSVPDPMTGLHSSLHIDTFLPLQLPPADLCAKSPLLAYPNSWWASEAEKKLNEVKSTNPVQSFPHQRQQSHQSFTSSSDEGESEMYSSLFGQPTANAKLRRSESLASFISAQSDGSWHGDQGDSDPDGQLARALGQVDTQQDYTMDETKQISPSNFATEAINSTAKTCSPDNNNNDQSPVQIQTYDYDEEIERQQEKAQIVASPSNADEEEMIDLIKTSNDVSEKHITQHTGPFLSKISSFLFNLNLLGSELSHDQTEQEDEETEKSSPFERRLSHSMSDGNLLGQLSSPTSLQTEMQSKQQHQSKRTRNYRNHNPRGSSRIRSATVAADSDLLNHGEVDEEDISHAFGLWSLWRWIIPDIDLYLGDLDHDQISRVDRNNVYMKRSPSLPSLISGSSLDSLVEDDEWEDFSMDRSMFTSNPIQSYGEEEEEEYEGALIQTFYGESDSRDSIFGLRSFGLQTKQQYSQTNFKTYFNNNNIKQSTNPSPLWDNRLDKEEEPYKRSWSSMLGLSVH